MDIDPRYFTKLLLLVVPEEMKQEEPLQDDRHEPLSAISALEEMKKTLNEVEHVLMSTRGDVENIVVLLKTENIGSKKMNILEEHQQLQEHVRQQYIHLKPYLVQIANWNERFAHLENGKNGSADFDPYLCLFTQKNSTGEILYGTETYLTGLKDGIEGAMVAYNIANSLIGKTPQVLVGIDRNLYAKLYDQDVLYGLSFLNQIITKRYFDIAVLLPCQVLVRPELTKNTEQESRQGWANLAGDISFRDATARNPRLQGSSKGIGQVEPENTEDTEVMDKDIGAVGEEDYFADTEQGDEYAISEDEPFPCADIHKPLSQTHDAAIFTSNLPWIAGMARGRNILGDSSPEDSPTDVEELPDSPFDDCKY